MKRNAYRVLTIRYLIFAIHRALKNWLIWVDYQIANPHKIYILGRYSTQEQCMQQSVKFEHIRLFSITRVPRGFQIQTMFTIPSANSRMLKKPPFSIKYFLLTCFKSNKQLAFMWTWLFAANWLSGTGMCGRWWSQREYMIEFYTLQKTRATWQDERRKRSFFIYWGQ